MFSALKLQALTPSIRRKNNKFKFAGNLIFSFPAIILRLPFRSFTILSFQSSQNALSSEPSISSHFTSSVGSPPLHLSHLRLSQRHITALNILACAVAISATWLFCSTIPALLAFKRAAESLEKLLDVTREELPDTMAAVRLSGMEISDLTMELSDLGQEITQGIRKSTRAVHMAEDKLCHFANMTSAGDSQHQNNHKSTTVEPALARTTRGLREGIVKGRAVIQALFALTGFSREKICGLHQVKLLHVPREENQVADSLAKDCRKNNVLFPFCNVRYSYDLPPFLLSMVQEDCKKLKGDMP